jgi:hypothetical protein
MSATRTFKNDETGSPGSGCEQFASSGQAVRYAPAALDGTRGNDGQAGWIHSDMVRIWAKQARKSGMATGFRLKPGVRPRPQNKSYSASETALGGEGGMFTCAIVSFRAPWAYGDDPGGILTSTTQTQTC